MRVVLDGQSLLVGAFAGAALVAGVGAAQNGVGEAGRYQITASGWQEGHAVYLLDTGTGKLWQRLNSDPFAPIRSPIEPR